jgi:hypothetical protein
VGDGFFHLGSSFGGDLRDRLPKACLAEVELFEQSIEVDCQLDSEVCGVGLIFW